MTVWLREIAGWVILFAGLAAFAAVYLFLANRWFLEGGIFAACGFLLLRTGTHLLKTATAARAAAGVRATAVPKARILTPVNAAAAGRPRPSVVPGAAGKRG